MSEILYFNKFFTQRYDEAYMGAGGRMSKHIFLGNDRIVTKQVALSTGETYDNADTGVEKQYTYYYHADHLGSTSVVTDSNGEVYERLEYTPYGETWLDETSSDTYFDTPYRFSAKEKDEETGLYYYGARYLDPKYSRWISADPALGEYLPQAPVNDEAKKHNKSLPGQGGVFNVINLNLYHYAGNNPIKYTDPDGKDIYNVTLAGLGVKFTAGGDVSFGFAWDDNGNVALLATGNAGVGVEGTLDTPITPGFSISKGININELTGKGVFKITGDASLNGIEAEVGVIIGGTMDLKTNKLSGYNFGMIGGGVNFVTGTLYVELKHGFEDLKNQYNKLNAEQQNVVIKEIQNSNMINDNVKTKVLNTLKGDSDE